MLFAGRWKSSLNVECYNLVSVKLVICIITVSYEL